MNELCESCIKRKTLYCPNSNECYSIKDSPQWLGDFQALQEIERLNNIINELENYIKENAWYYNTSDGCQWIDQFKLLDKLNELRGEQ